ncbi:hypothetical protein G9A89_021766 [Geosiphon pyriformis]|nr:hypothetical protein G9A89_021766 [Geosiphon pyriformis]
MGSQNLQYPVLVLPPHLLLDATHDPSMINASNVSAANNNNNNNNENNNNNNNNNNRNIISNALNTINAAAANNNNIQYETRMRNFRGSQENLRTYFIPEGFTPVLIPTQNLNIIRARQQFEQKDNRDNESIPLAPSSYSSSTPSLSNLRKSPAAVHAQHQITALDIYYKSKRTELSSDDTSGLSLKMVIEMWDAEPEEVKRRFKRIALRQRIEMNLRMNPRVSMRLPLGVHRQYDRS